MTFGVLIGCDHLCSSMLVSPQSFDPDVTRSTDRRGNLVTKFRLPRTKCSPTGEDVFWAKKSGVVPCRPRKRPPLPLSAQQFPPNEFLFWNSITNQRRPLTRTKFLERVNAAVAATGLEPSDGHGLRIGARISSICLEAFLSTLSGLLVGGPAMPSSFTYGGTWSLLPGIFTTRFTTNITFATQCRL
ncbi:hypothetical protein CPC08DRAFT_771696 [Agrocybe pediades]|nr:hypothetical protein CPC08DRAFT_771696 [Agrocybe pediades]